MYAGSVIPRVNLLSVVRYLSDELIMFRPLSHSDVREIVKLQLHQLPAKLEEKGYQPIPSEELSSTTCPNQAGSAQQASIRRSCPASAGSALDRSNA